jgi:hypothetical protein
MCMDHIGVHEIALVCTLNRTGSHRIALNRTELHGIAIYQAKPIKATIFKINHRDFSPERAFIVQYLYPRETCIIASQVVCSEMTLNVFESARRPIVAQGLDILL